MSSISIKCLNCCLAKQKMKFSIKDLFSKYNQIRRKLRIWPYLLKKSLMEKFIFCVVSLFKYLYVAVVQK